MRAISFERFPLHAVQVFLLEGISIPPFHFGGSDLFLVKGFVLLLQYATLFVDSALQAGEGLVFCA